MRDLLPGPLATVVAVAAGASALLLPPFSPLVVIFAAIAVAAAAQLGTVLRELRRLHDERRRIELATTAARDTDGIPKVADAGTVREHDGRRVQVMHNGLLVEAGAYQGAWESEVIRRLRGHHEPQQEAAFHAVVERLARDGAPVTAVELGSSWGYYSMWAMTALPGTRCVLVEADAAALEAGRRNLRLNGLEAETVGARVGATDGGGMTTLHALADRLGIERIDLLHADIDGAEADMLDGARALIEAGRVRFVVISTHHAGIAGEAHMHRRCLEILKKHRAHVVAEHPVEASASGDGLIVASFDHRDRDLHVELSRVEPRDALYRDAETRGPGRPRAAVRMLRWEASALIRRAGGGR
jgi:predicted O-methyltransferase YrrM